MSHRSGVVLFLTVSLAAVLASACGEDGDDDGGAGAGGSGGSSAGTGGKGGSSGSSAGTSGSGTGGSSGKGGASGAGGSAGKGGAGGLGGASGAGGSAGKGGAGGFGGKGGAGGGAGTGESGGTAGAPDCELVQCLRPIDCVETCGGPVLKSSCCPCDEGTFDNFECEGSGGSGSRRGFDSGGTSGEPNNGGAGGGFDLSDLNSDCVDDECPQGLTPIHYYGVAGPGGPEFCSCSIPCDEGPSACPDGTECVNVSDGPGNVCWVP